MTTTPMTLKNEDMRPPAISRGRNAATVVSTPKMTGTATSQVPSTAAWTGGLPSCSWACTRSPTTMASSTRMPSTRMKDITVIVLMDTSKKGKSAIVPSMAIGMPTATHMASRNRRKRARTASTSTRPEPAVRSSVLTRSCRSLEASAHTASSMPSGIRRRASAT